MHIIDCVLLPVFHCLITAIGLSTQGSGDEINFVVYDFNESEY